MNMIYVQLNKHEGWEKYADEMFISRTVEKLHGRYYCKYHIRFFVDKKGWFGRSRKVGLKEFVGAESSSSMDSIDEFGRHLIKEMKEIIKRYSAPQIDKVTEIVKKLKEIGLLDLSIERERFKVPILADEALKLLES